MTCEFTFLAVGNADSIIIRPDSGPSVLVDIPVPRSVTKWLQTNGISDVGSIFITHAHRDHFAPITHFAAFIEQWVRGGGKVREIFLSIDILKSAVAELRTLKTSNQKKYLALHHAITYLRLWGGKRFYIQDAVRSRRPCYTAGQLSIRILHPEAMFLAEHSSTSATRLNERSIILKVNYKNFAAILLADLEGVGISECLDKCTPGELKAHLVKIPHHGAWPANGADLEALLRQISAEIAVLSVGSKNPYGHVASELFQLLLTLKSEKSLKQFICTEATRTCVHSASERKTMDKSGLAYKLPCAGDISVVADESGSWMVNTATNHSTQLTGIKYAVCEGRGDI